MALVPASGAPEDVITRLADEFPTSEEGPPAVDWHMHFWKEKRSSSLRVSRPHPVYTVGVRNAKRGKVLEAARLSSWRCIIFDGDVPVFSGEVDTQVAGGASEFSHLTDGPSVRETVEALLRAEEREDIEQGEFEVRYLKVQGLYVTALWFYDMKGAGGRDLVVPMAPVPGRLAVGRFYPAKEFEEAMKRLATMRLKFGEDEEP